MFVHLILSEIRKNILVLIIQFRTLPQQTHTTLYFIVFVFNSKFKLLSLSTRKKVNNDSLRSPWGLHKKVHSLSYATLQGMDISLLPLHEKNHNFHKNALFFKIKVTFFRWDAGPHDGYILKALKNILNHFWLVFWPFLSIFSNFSSPT